MRVKVAATSFVAHAIVSLNGTTTTVARAITAMTFSVRVSRMGVATVSILASLLIAALVGVGWRLIAVVPDPWLFLFLVSFFSEEVTFVHQIDVLFFALLEHLLSTIDYGR